MSALTCAAVRDAACELALDILDGDERAAALAHLETCAACREEVASLTRAADELLLLVREVEPVPGLDERVLARLGEAVSPPAMAARRSPHGLRRAMLAAAAVVLVLAMAGTLALRARPASQEAVGRTAAMRTVSGQVVGDVTLGPDPGAVRVSIPDWVGLVRTYRGTVAGPYWLMVERAGGAHDLHRLPSAEERPWTIAAGADPGTVRSVSVVDDKGTVWCSARFSA